MKAFFAVLAVIFATLVAGVYVALRAAPEHSGVNTWIDAYFSQARIPMFTGFLTVGSFLLTLQTAIIQRLKDAFDTEDYKNRFLVLKERNPHLRYYGSLERMSIALSANVILALATAVAQLTIGFVRTELSTAVCIGLAGTSILLVVFLTIQLLMAHKEWFVKIEESRRQDLRS